MKVSVIVPNYNHSRFLRQRIDTILEQSYQDFELILLDDKSTDNSIDVLREYEKDPHVSCIVVNEENSGSPFKQWEKGITLAKGEYIWIAESDDYAHSDFLKCCVEQLDKHPTASICHTGSIIVDEEGKPLPHSYDSWSEESDKETVYKSIPYVRHNMLFMDDCYNASKVVFRRSAYNKIENTFTTFRCAGDWLFMVSLIMQGDVVTVHRKLNNFRWHTNSTTRQSNKDSRALHDQIRLFSEIFKLVPICAYNRWLICGIIYKNIKRKNLPAEESSLLKKEAEQLLNMKKWHYIVERINKTLTNIIPQLPTGKRYSI